MDLKAILASKKSKTERANIALKPVTIADQDRPYSLADVSDIAAKTSEPPYSTLPQIDEVVTQHKPIINPDSLCIETKTDSKPTTKWQQTDNKVAAN